MRIVVAPDKFKGSVTAREAAAHLAAGIRDASPDADVVELPVADGGEGTLDAALDRLETAVAAVTARAAERAGQSPAALSA